MHIVISRKGKVVSLYEIEKFFQDNKNKAVINIADEVILTRFRLAVKNNEIEPFTITVKDLDGTLTTEKCTVNGKLCDVWNTKILNTQETMVMELF